MSYKEYDNLGLCLNYKGITNQALTKADLCNNNHNRYLHCYYKTFFTPKQNICFVGGLSVETYLTVKEVAHLLNKSEETIKRWIRSGKIQNATKENDKSGWRIPNSALNVLLASPMTKNTTKINAIPADFSLSESQKQERELVILAFEAVTMTSPTEEIINILSFVGIKRTLEVLLTMQQSPTKVKNPIGFIKKAISKGWTPTTLPIKKERNVARINKQNESTVPLKPFYNWLED